MEAKMGTVEFFENYLEGAMLKNEDTSHEALYRIGFGVFDLISEGTFSPTKKDHLEHLLNLREAMNNISKRLTSRWEEIL